MSDELSTVMMNIGIVKVLIAAGARIDPDAMTLTKMSGDMEVWYLMMPYLAEQTLGQGR